MLTFFDVPGRPLLFCVDTTSTGVYIWFNTMDVLMVIQHNGGCHTSTSTVLNQWNDRTNYVDLTQKCSGRPGT